MSHPNRSARKANVLRRKEQERRQKPLPIEEQHRRRDANAAARLARYPVPPVYGDAGELTPTLQPASYAFAHLPLLGVLARSSMARMARRLRAS